MNTSCNDDKIISCDRALDFGTIEKLCPKYGFIKCLSKTSQEKKLFFHSSATLVQYEELSIGDYVTFERTISNGKPLATKVQLSTELIEGTIVKMPRKNELGSISYEVSGESFFVNFEKTDVMEDGKLRTKDEVSFEKIERDGKNYAIHIRRRYNKPMRVQGVVTSVKEKFGFIDRSDVVKEIYFNLGTTPHEVKPGDEVEFNVKHLRNGKEEAVNIRFLEKGTVKFVNVLDNIVYGTLLRSPDTRRTSNSDLLAGNISYVFNNNGKVLQIPFGERDKKYPYSMQPGDIVSFKIAVDLRDQLQRACQVELCLDKFPSRKETRNIGVIKMFDGTAGLIEPDLPSKSKGDNMLVAFKAREWLCPNKLRLDKFLAVSYTPLLTNRTTKSDGSNNNYSTGNGSQSSRYQTALRILPIDNPDEQMSHLKLYPAGSLRGVVKSTDISGLDIIIGQINDMTRSIAFNPDDVLDDNIRNGDEVEFGCLERINCNYLPPTAFNVKSTKSVTSHNRKSLCNGSSPLTQSSIFNVGNTTTHSSTNYRGSSDLRKHRSKTLPDNKMSVGSSNNDYLDYTGSTDTTEVLFGWIVIMKERFGFIESSDHNILYKFNPFQLPEDIQLGCYVEFNRNTTRHKFADNVKSIESLSSSTIEDSANYENTQSKLTQRQRFYVGQITSALGFYDGASYPGTIRDMSETTKEFSYTMKSLLSFRSKLVKDDRVLYRICPEVPQRAICVTPLRQFGRVINIVDNHQSHHNNGHLTDNCSGQIMSNNISVLTIRRCSSSLDDTNYKNQSPIPVEFEFDDIALEQMSTSATIDQFNTDDLVEIDLDLQLDQQKIVVNNVKPLKISNSMQPTSSYHNDNLAGPSIGIASSGISATGSRKIYKSQLLHRDENHEKIQHLRSPKLPETESIGFTDQLKLLPDTVLQHPDLLAIAQSLATNVDSIEPDHTINTAIGDQEIDGNHSNKTKEITSPQ